MVESNIHDIIVCPCEEHSLLIRQNEKLKCSKKNCIHSKEEGWFSCVSDTPVLISEEKCDTVCSPHQVDSYVSRAEKSGIRSLLLKLLSGTSKTTLENCSNFVDLLISRSKNGRVLVIGSGERGSGTDRLFETESLLIIGTDIYLSDTVDVISDAHYLPFKDEVFDGVWIQAVLEHVVDPRLVVSEIHRVLKADGIVYAETPFMQQVHEGAYDFTRFTVLGHRYLFKRFTKIRIGGNKGVGTVLTWSIRYFVWGVFRSRHLARAVAILIGLPLRVIERFADRRSLFDASSGVYFLGKKSQTEISQKDLIKNYRGFQ